MELILPAHRTQMLANFMSEGPDHAPVVKWFCPRSGATWLLTEMAADDEDLLFGLCDLGLDFPEFDYVSRAEVEADMGVGGLKIERDPTFEPMATISVYVEAARRAERTVFEIGDLLAAYQRLAEKARQSGEILQARLLNENGKPMSFAPAKELETIS